MHKFRGETASKTANHPQENEQDKLLLAGISAKDRQAFEQFYYRYRPRIFRFLCKLIAQPELIEEALNDVMFSVWQNAGKFQGRSKVSTWVFGIAYFKGLKVLERSSSASAFDVDQYIMDMQLIKEPDNELYLDNRQRYLISCLGRLPAEQRIVVELTYYNGFSYAEIAEITDIPVNTVKTRMFHARQKLRKIISDMNMDHIFE